MSAIRAVKNSKPVVKVLPRDSYFWGIIVALVCVMFLTIIPFLMAGLGS